MKRPVPTSNHTMGKLFAIGLGLWLAVGIASADEVPGATPHCADTALDAVQRRYEAVRDLAAEFTQTSWSVTLGAGGERAPAESSGTVVFAKPGKMRWSYAEPEESLVVSDGETLWLYDPAAREAQRLPLRDGFFSAAAIQFLLGEGNMQRDFDVTALSCSASEVELELLPKSPASYERLGIVADPRSGDLAQTRVVDLLGNITEIHFTDIRVNRDPAAAVFTFEAPANVDVIDLGVPRGPER